MEVYIGVLSIPLIFIGMSSILGTLLYWQIMRVRYVTNYGCQRAFANLDQKINQYVLSKSFCPGFIKSGYAGLKSMLNQQTEMAYQQAQ